MTKKSASGPIFLFGFEAPDPLAPTWQLSPFSRQSWPVNIKFGNSHATNTIDYGRWQCSDVPCKFSWTLAKIWLSYGRKDLFPFNLWAFTTNLTHLILCQIKVYQWNQPYSYMNILSNSRYENILNCPKKTSKCTN